MHQQYLMMGKIIIFHFLRCLKNFLNRKSSRDDWGTYIANLLIQIKQKPIVLFHDY